MLSRAGGNWVDGDLFFDREIELELLEERVRDGIHTSLVAQRRMGKTSLVRELLRCLAKSGEYETVFVDLGSAANSADAIAEIGIQARSVQEVWQRIRAGIAGFGSRLGSRVEAVTLADARERLRATIDAVNWKQKGDDVIAVLADNERPIVLAIDELPMLFNRLLKGESGEVTLEGRRTADDILSWLRKAGQTHQARIPLILSGVWKFFGA